MRILRGRRLQALAREFSQPRDQRRRPIELRNEGRKFIDQVPADAAPLLVPGKIVPVDRAADGRDRRHEFRRDLGREKVLEIEEVPLFDEFTPQRNCIESRQAIGNCVGCIDIYCATSWEPNGCKRRISRRYSTTVQAA